MDSLMRIDINFIAAISGGTLVPVILGITIIIFSGRDIKNSEESSDWPETEGVILESRINERNNDGTILYAPFVMYSYTVSRKTYNSYRISYMSGECDDIKIIQNLIADYPIGKSVTVYYKPENPEVSILEKADVNYKFLPYVGWVLVVLGVALAGLTLKSSRK